MKNLFKTITAAACLLLSAATFAQPPAEHDPKAKAILDDLSKTTKTYKTISAEYDLEYGSNSVEMHKDAISAGERVVIVDDLLATGGTTRATIELVEQLGAEIVAPAFLIELGDLGARDYLQGYNIVTLIKY